MARLYVENVPDELYDALRQRAKERQKSVSAELLEILADNVPTATELARRRELLSRALKIRSKRPVSAEPFPSAEEMQREDRIR